MNFMAKKCPLKFHKKFRNTESPPLYLGIIPKKTASLLVLSLEKALLNLLRGSYIDYVIADGEGCAQINTILRWGEGWGALSRVQKSGQNTVLGRSQRLASRQNVARM